jgi:hypothetical protein
MAKCPPRHKIKEIGTMTNKKMPNNRFERDAGTAVVLCHSIVSGPRPSIEALMGENND